MKPSVYVTIPCVWCLSDVERNRNVKRPICINCKAVQQRDRLKLSQREFRQKWPVRGKILLLTDNMNHATNSIEIKGYVRLVCRDAEGNVKWDTGLLKNIITTAGKAQIALLAGDASATPFTYLAVGTSATAESNAHTALQAEITTNGLARAAATVSRTTTTTTNDTLQLTYTWTSSGTHVVEEVGILNASSAGTLLGRKLTSTKTVLSGEFLTGTYQIVFA